jgi:hypothetical protein
MSSSDGSTDLGAPGWDAINEALRPLYGAQKPLHWGTLINYRLGGPDPLDGISAYAREAPTPHWHFITFGFSELYEKESTDLAVSGYGFELTFRLSRSRTESTPPAWVLSFLQNLARYVFDTGNPFGRGHYMNANGPIALGVQTEIRAMVLDLDSELPPRDTANGHVDFLEVVGITLDELDAIKAWSSERFLDVLKERIPLLVTDIERKSILQDPSLADRIDGDTRRDGSSTESLFLGHCDWAVKQGVLDGKTLHVTLGANGVRDVKVVLPGRVPHGRELSIISSHGSITFVPGDAPSWEVSDDGARITLPGPVARRLSEALLPRAGFLDFKEVPNTEFEVVKSEIRDRDGNVVAVVG